MKSNNMHIPQKMFLAIAAFLGIFAMVFPGKLTTKISASATGPSASHTNAPGEGNCTECHGQFTVNSGTGSVSISGLPPTYWAGQRIEFTVTTSQEDATIFGFQLTAIDESGDRAGSFSIVPMFPQPIQIIDGVVDGHNREYIEHTVDGIVPTMFGAKSWDVVWTAPENPSGPISFYAAGNAADSDGSPSGDYIYTTSAQIMPKSAPFDFDGDGKTEVGIFRPADGSWWYLQSSDSQYRVYSFGLGSDRIVPGDYTGDGKTDIAIFRPSSGEWFIQRSDDNTYYSIPFGNSSDTPVPADYDGDGKADIAVFRDSTQNWFILNSGGGTVITTFGIAGDKPVFADYDGDGKADIAIFRPGPGEWWYSRSGGGSTVALTFGTSTDKQVQGDYTGDGKADVAFFRPSTGFWFIQRSEDNSFYSVPFGTTGDLPAPGDYDGDGRYDTTVFRPSSATWFSNRSTAGTVIVTFGINGDQPLPAAFVP